MGRAETFLMTTILRLIIGGGQALHLHQERVLVWNLSRGCLWHVHKRLRLHNQGSQPGPLSWALPAVQVMLGTKRGIWEGGGRCGA